MDSYSDLWTNIENYALVEVPESLKKQEKQSHVIYERFPLGYTVFQEAFWIRKKQKVINKMLKSGVQVLNHKDIEKTNEEYYLWIDRDHENLDEESQRLRDHILEYSNMWTDVDEYVLIEIPETNYLRRVEQTHYVFKRHQFGYHIVFILNKSPQSVIDKMLVEGVRISSREEIEDANQP